MDFFQRHRKAIVTSLALYGGYYVYKAYWAPETQNLNPSSSIITPDDSSSTKQQEKEKNQFVVYTIPELGISLELPVDLSPNAFWSRTPLVKFGEQNQFYLIIFEDYQTKKEALKLFEEYDMNVSTSDFESSVVTKKIQNGEYKGFEGEITSSSSPSAETSKKWFFIIPSFKRTMMFVCEYDPKQENQAQFLEIAKKAIDSIKIEQQKNIGTTKFFKKFLLSASNSSKSSSSNETNEKMLKFTLSIELPDLNFFAEKPFSENEIFHLRFAKVNKSKSAGIKLLHFADLNDKFSTKTTTPKQKREFLSEIVDFYKASLTQISNWKISESLEFDIADNSLSKVLQYDQIINEKTFHVTGNMFLKNGVPFLIIFYSYVKLLKYFSNYNTPQEPKKTNPTIIEQTLKSLNISLSTENIHNFSSEWISYQNKKQSFSVKFPSKMKFINEKLDDVVCALSSNPATGAPYIETSIGTKEKIASIENPEEIAKMVEQDLQREKEEAQREIGETYMNILSQDLVENGCNFIYKFQNSLFTTELGNPIITIVFLTCISHDDNIYTIRSQAFVERDAQIQQVVDDMSAIHTTATFL